MKLKCQKLPCITDIGKRSDGGDEAGQPQRGADRQLCGTI